MGQAAVRHSHYTDCGPVSIPGGDSDRGVTCAVGGDNTIVHCSDAFIITAPRHGLLVALSGSTVAVSAPVLPSVRLNVPVSSDTPLTGMALTVKLAASDVPTPSEPEMVMVSLYVPVPRSALGWTVKVAAVPGVRVVVESGPIS